MKTKKNKMRLQIGAPIATGSRRWIFGTFCAMVALVRVTVNKGLDKELGIAPLYYIDPRDGRPKANLVLEIIRWCPEEREFCMERRGFLIPHEYHGKEMYKDREIRVKDRQELRVGKLSFRKTKQSEMQDRALEYLIGDIESHMQLFDIPYTMEDAHNRLPQPRELTGLPKTLPAFSVLAPEKAMITKIVTKTDTEGHEREQSFEVKAVPRFHGGLQFKDVLQRTDPALQERGLLNITGLEVDCYPLVLWADVVRLLGWTPVHISALANNYQGLKVEALDKRQFAFTDVAPASDVEQRLDMWGRWRELVKTDEVLAHYPELAKLAPDEVMMAVSDKHLAVFEKAKGVGLKTAEKIRSHLLKSEFVNWLQQYESLARLVSDHREKRIKAEMLEAVEQLPATPAVETSEAGNYASF